METLEKVYPAELVSTETKTLILVGLKFRVSLMKSAARATYALDYIHTYK